MDGPYRGLDSEFQLRTHLEGEWLAFETLAQAYFWCFEKLVSEVCCGLVSRRKVLSLRRTNPTVHQAVVLVHGSGALALPQIDLL